MRKLTQEYCRGKVREKFGSKVTLIKYNGDTNKSLFKCKKHGEFETRLANLLRGAYPCKKCFREDQPNIARKDNAKYISKVKKLFGDKYDFCNFKPLGMTDKSVLICPIKTRMYGFRDYETQVLHLESGEAKHIYEKELFLKRMFKEFSYVPNIKFGGYTECFSNLDKISLYVN